MKPKPHRNKKNTSYCRTQAEYCALYGLSRSTIERYQAAGAPLDDPNALKEWASKQRSRPASLDPANINDAKLKKLGLECERLAFRLEVDRGLFTPNEKVVEVFTRIGATVASCLDQLRADLPALLLGKDELGMAEIIERETRKIRSILADQGKDLCPKT